MQASGDEQRVVRRIFWTGLIVRLLYITLAHTYRVRPLLDHFQFGWEDGRVARALVNGYGYADPFVGHTGPTAWMPPLYPLLMAGVFKLFGVYSAASAWVILAINSVFSAATAPLIYRIAWRCFERTGDGLKIALWSAWLWALYPAAMQYAVRWVWDMSLTAFLFAAVILLALRLRDNPAALKPWLLFGLLWGLIALSNSSLLTFLPFCAGWIVWPTLPHSGTSFWRRQNLRSCLANLTLSAILCAAIVTPWIVRNAIAFHAFVPMRTNFGAELYQAAQPASEGYPWVATLPLAETAPEFQRYKRLGELAYSKQQGERAMALIRTHRGVFATHILKRIYFFWNSVPHPTDQGLAVEVTREANFAFLSLCGLFGLTLALRHHIPGAWLFFWAFAIYPLTYYAITVQARFRHPLEPLICILGVFLFRSAKRGEARL